MEGSRRRYIRVRVEIELDKPPVLGFFLERPARDPLWITVKYERLPGGCSTCGRLSHTGDGCKYVGEMGRSREQEMDSMETAAQTSGEAHVPAVGQVHGREAVEELAENDGRERGRRERVRSGGGPPTMEGGGRPDIGVGDARLHTSKEKGLLGNGSSKERTDAGTDEIAGAAAADDSTALVPAVSCTEKGDITAGAVMEDMEMSGTQENGGMEAVAAWAGDSACGKPMGNEVELGQKRQNGSISKWDGPGLEDGAQRKSNVKLGVRREEVDDRPTKVYRRGKKEKGKGVAVDNGRDNRYHPYSGERNAIQVQGSRVVAAGGNNESFNRSISAEAARLPRREP
ncbi:unnamed protein product [Rhodiola kirilowii]